MWNHDPHSRDRVEKKRWICAGYGRGNDFAITLAVGDGAGGGGGHRAVIILVIVSVIPQMWTHGYEWPAH